MSEIALASLRSMSAGKYTDMEKAPIVLPRGLYAKQDGGDVTSHAAPLHVLARVLAGVCVPQTHVGPRLPEGFVAPKAAKKESGSRSTPGASVSAILRPIFPIRPIRLEAPSAFAQLRLRLCVSFRVP